MINPENSNQTKFAFEEPIFTDVNVELPVDESAINPENNKNRKKKLIIIIGIFVFLFLTFLIMIMMAANKKQPVIQEIDPEEPQVIIETGPFEDRINNARLYLEVADPSNQDLTFPPVDMKLRLDEKTRR